jgi:ATP-binding protein involved in chromosome partitioning
VSVNVTVKIASHSVQRGVQLLPNVKNIIVASGKGAAKAPPPNLALALAAEGCQHRRRRDIYGSSRSP